MDETVVGKSELDDRDCLFQYLVIFGFENDL